MFPACTKMGGNAMAAPDVCKVPAPPAPPVPTPFPNTAMMNMANGMTCSKKVKIVNMPVITKASEVALTMGDEAGVAGGLVSGRNMDKAVFRAGSAKVKVEGNDLVTQLKPTAHNGANANAPVGQVLSPSQTKVFAAG